MVGLYSSSKQRLVRSFWTFLGVCFFATLFYSTVHVLRLGWAGLGWLRYLGIGIGIGIVFYRVYLVYLTCPKRLLLGALTARQTDRTRGLYRKGYRYFLCLPAYLPAGLLACSSFGGRGGKQLACAESTTAMVLYSCKKAKGKEEGGGRGGEPKTMVYAGRSVGRSVGWPDVLLRMGLI